MKRRVVALAALVAVVGACSSPSDSAPASQPTPSEVGSTIDPDNGDGGHDHGSHGGFGDKGGSDENDADSQGNGGGRDSGASSTDAGGDGEGGASSSGDGGSSEGDGTAATAAYPAGGTYVYSQKGTEAFCDPAGNCETYDLPPTQKVATSYSQRTQTEAIVVTEVKPSNGRLVRTTTHFTPDAAFVTEVYYRLTYEGLQLQEQYVPEPPVPQLRFPLRAGREWKASWKADTSGDYHARVAGLERVKTAAGAVDAFRIETLTKFRGELEGKASIVMWFDPATRAVVRTNGALNLRASYGGYNTTFETSLKSAPGY